jgi:endonuclease/exonuclease/phosphatase family metal-dependent hydrolase
MMSLCRVLSVILVLLFIIGCSEDVPVTSLNQSSSELENDFYEKANGGRASVKTMTYNIYIGANVDIVLTATSFEDLIVKVAAAYDTLFLTNFPERAQAIAKLIKRHRPHFIGLQEVTLIQRFDQIPPTTLYEEINFLEILMNALAAQGVHYQFADSIQNADVTLPRLAGFDPGGNPIIDFIRVVDADAILVRGDVPFHSPFKGAYQAQLPVNSPAGTFYIPRGFVSVVATVNQKSYRFVDTHLEPFSELVRLFQAQELCAVFAGETLPTIMVGDFNTLDPTQPHPLSDSTYKFMTKTCGYTDTWLYNLKGNEGEGYTSPFSAALRDPFPNLYQRIDLIFAKNFADPIGPVKAEVIGDRFKDRTPSGLWPSDHAGVVAKLHLLEMNGQMQNQITVSQLQD